MPGNGEKDFRGEVKRCYLDCIQSGRTPKQIQFRLAEAMRARGLQPSGRSTMDTWLKGKRMPRREAVLALHEVIGLPYPDADAAEGKFGPLKWGHRRGEAAAPEQAAEIEIPPTYKTTLDAIDELHERIWCVLEGIGTLTRGLFTRTCGEHFLVSSTSGMSLLILGDNEIADAQRENRFDALDRGLLWALIIPDSSYLDDINTSYDIDFTDSYRQLQTGFDDLRLKYVEHRKRLFAHPPGDGQRPHEQYAHTHMQSIECDDFPMTPLHWTVSLIGWRRKTYRPTTLRAIVRAPYGEGHSYQVFPGGGDQDYEQDLLRWFRRVVQRRYDEIKGSASSPEIEWEARFCQQLLDRMPRPKRPQGSG